LQFAISSVEFYTKTQLNSNDAQRNCVNRNLLTGTTIKKLKLNFLSIIHLYFQSDGKLGKETANHSKLAGH